MDLNAWKNAFKTVSYKNSTIVFKRKNDLTAYYCNWVFNFSGTFDKDDKTCSDIAEFSACGTKLVIETVSFSRRFKLYMYRYIYIYI